MSAPSPLLYGRIAELYDTSLELFGFKRSLGRALDRLVP